MSQSSQKHWPCKLDGLSLILGICKMPDIVVWICNPPRYYSRIGDGSQRQGKHLDPMGELPWSAQHRRIKKKPYINNQKENKITPQSCPLTSTYGLLHTLQQIHTHHAYTKNNFHKSIENFSCFFKRQRIKNNEKEVRKAVKIYKWYLSTRKILIKQF